MTLKKYEKPEPVITGEATTEEPTTEPEPEPVDEPVVQPQPEPESDEQAEPEPEPQRSVLLYIVIAGVGLVGIGIVVWYLFKK
ncbi:hypothetical protein GF342_00165 [Candidatus Woesearchaeota archaeon]|nr:hypothetical protein [Candidatus Woesearchaeota archaeon]